MMLAELSGLETASIIGGFAFGAIGLIIAGVAAFKKTETVISPQPLTVEVVKALHEQFADRDEFLKLVNHTTERHGQLFKRIDQVERDARVEMERRLTELNGERRQTLEKLGTEFTFIRENIAAINRELQIRNKL